MDFSLLDHLQNPVVAVDDKFKLVYFNHICSTYFKLPPRKIKKTGHICELLNVDQKVLEESIRAVLANNVPAVTPELPLKLPEKPNKVMTVILKLIPLDKFTLIHLNDFSIEKQLHDKYKDQIEELKDTHEQIVRSDRLTALGELTAGIGHEIANPLTIVADKLLGVEEGIATKNSQLAKENLDVVVSCFKRISKIITNMQSFVKDEEEELQIVSLKEVMDASTKFVGELDFSEGVNLNTKVEGDVFVLADTIKMQQVLINLLKNSVQAMASAETKDSTIEIKLIEDLDEQLAVIQVFDNGPGIREEIKGNIFNMFFTTKEIGEGTGLGLSITQKIVESFNGTIQLIDSKVGALFEIQIPLAEISTFTVTNKYFNGEKEVEDPKILVLGNRADILNEIFVKLKDEDFVTILSNRFKDLKTLQDFYRPDKILYFGKELEIPEYKSILVNISELVAKEEITSMNLLAKVND